MATSDIYDGDYPEPTGSTSASCRYVRVTFLEARYDDLVYISSFVLANGTTILTTNPNNMSASNTIDGDVKGLLVYGSASGYLATYYSSTYSVSQDTWTGTTNDWIKYDLGSTVTVDTLAIEFNCSTFTDIKLSPFKIKIETSTDDVTYSTTYEGYIREPTNTNTYNQYSTPPNYYQQFRAIGEAIHLNGDKIVDFSSITADTSGGDGYRYFMLDTLRRTDHNIDTNNIYPDMRIYEIDFFTSDGFRYPSDDNTPSGYLTDRSLSTYISEATTTTVMSDLVLSDAPTAGSTLNFTMTLSHSGMWQLDFLHRINPVGIKLHIPKDHATASALTAFKLYGTNDGVNFDLLLYVNDYEWPTTNGGTGTLDAYFPIDLTGDAGVFTASGFVIRNGVPAQADVHFYNASTKELIYSTTSSAIDGSWTYASGTNAPILVVVEGEESEGYQIQGRITPT